MKLNSLSMPAHPGLTAMLQNESQVRENQGTLLCHGWYGASQQRWGNMQPQAWASTVVPDCKLCTCRKAISLPCFPWHGAGYFSRPRLSRPSEREPYVSVKKHGTPAAIAISPFTDYPLGKQRQDSGATLAMDIDSQHWFSLDR